MSSIATSSAPSVDATTAAICLPVATHHQDTAALFRQRINIFWACIRDKTPYQFGGWSAQRRPPGPTRPVS